MYVVGYSNGVQAKLDSYILHDTRVSHSTRLLLSSSNTCWDTATSFPSLRSRFLLLSGISTKAVMGDASFRGVLGRHWNDDRNGGCLWSKKRAVELLIEAHTFEYSAFGFQNPDFIHSGNHVLQKRRNEVGKGYGSAVEIHLDLRGPRMSIKSRRSIADTNGTRHFF